MSTRIGRHHPLKTSGAKRSSQWPGVRKAHLKKQPNCVVCGGSKKIEVHHIRPFHLHPQLELDPKNLITLCENDGDGVNCHLAVGHLGSFKSYNEHVKRDAPYVAKRIKKRPLK